MKSNLKKLFTKNRILFSIVLFLICTLILLAMQWSPQQYRYRVVQEDDIVADYTSDDITGYEGCAVVDDMVTTLDDTSHISFENLGGVTGKTVELELGQPLDMDFQALLLATYADGNGETEGIFVYAPAGADSICWSVQERPVEALHFYMVKDYELVSMRVHAQAADYVECKDNSQIRGEMLIALAYAIAGAIVLMILAFILDAWRKWSTRIPAWWRDNGRQVCKDILLLAATVVIGLLVEGLIAHGTGMNWRIAFLISGVLAAAAWFYICRGSLAEHPERLMAGMILITGITMILIMPYGHVSWDTDTHFRLALSDSFIRNGYYTEADLSVVNNDRFFQMSGDSWSDMLYKIGVMNEKGSLYYQAIPRDLDLAHLGSGIAIALIRLFGGGFFEIYTFGKLGTLLVYTIVCYYAMKILRSGKMILGVIAMIPTAVFIASNYSYDYWVMCFGLLGLAMFVAECQQPEKPTSWKKLFLMWGILLVGALPKIVYAVWMIIPFFLPRKKISHRKIYNGLFILALILGCAAVGAMILYTAHTTGDLRGGAEISPGGQMAFILSNKGRFASIMVHFMGRYLSFQSARAFIIDFAYWGLGNYGAFLLVVVLLVIATITDKKTCDVQATNWGLRIGGIIFYILMAFLTAFVLYLVFTPVGYETVKGCQGRYLLPLLYPLLAFLGPGRFQNRMNRGRYHGLILCGSTIAIFINLFILVSRGLLS